MTSRSDVSSDGMAATTHYCTGEHAELLLDLVTTCNEALNTNQALQEIIDRVCRFAGFDVGHAYVTAYHDPKRLRSSGVFNSNVSPEFSTFCHRSSNVSFRSGEGLVGRALSECSAVWIADYAGAQFARSQAASDAGIKSALAIPILRDNEALGVIEFFSTEEVAPSDRLNTILLRTAAQIGCVILRDRRSADAIVLALADDEVRRRDAAMNHIDDAIGDDRAISHALDLITTKIATELEVDAAHVLLCAANDQMFELLPTVSPPVRVIHFPTERHRSDPARRAAIDGEAVHIDNVHDLEPHEALPGYMSAQGVRSYYAVPLHGTDGVNGILEICGKLPRRRNDVWLHTLALLAGQTAAALERYRIDTEEVPPSDEFRKAA